MHEYEPPEDALVRAIDEALRGTSLGVLRFIELERERKHSSASYRQARQQYLDATNPDRPHTFDVRSLPSVIRVVGHAEWLAPLLAVEAREMRRRRAG